jgi:hypothetical protein
MFEKYSAIYKTQIDKLKGKLEVVGSNNSNFEKMIDKGL